MLVSDLSLTGDGAQVGADGAGVTTTLAGHGQTGVIDGKPTDTHIEASPLTVQGQHMS